MTEWISIERKDLDALNERAEKAEQARDAAIADGIDWAKRARRAEHNLTEVINEREAAIEDRERAERQRDEARAESTMRGNALRFVVSSAKSATSDHLIEHAMEALEANNLGASTPADSEGRERDIAKSALKDISMYMHTRGDLQDHAMRQITEIVQKALELDNG